MNNTFSFKRFEAVVARDWRSVLGNYGITLLVFCSIPTLPWLTSLVFGIGEVDQSVRWFVLGLSAILAVMIAAEKIYGNANHPREGVAFAMLPATNMEKFFSMSLYCAVVVPVAVMMGLWCVDALLALIPLPIYKGVLSIPLEEYNPSLGWAVVFLIVCWWFVSALFMLGNMFFSRRKTAKTFAWSQLFIFSIGMILQAFDAWEGILRFFYNMSESFSPWFLVIVIFIVNCVLFYLTYRRIKTQKY